MLRQLLFVEGVDYSKHIREYQFHIHSSPWSNTSLERAFLYVSFFTRPYLRLLTVTDCRLGAFGMRMFGPNDLTFCCH
jgi:hypothetical protein